MRESDVLEEIIDIGVKRGNLTYDEIHNVLPSEFFTLDELVGIMNLLDDMGVKVVDFRRPSSKVSRKKTG